MDSVDMNSNKNILTRAPGTLLPLLLCSMAAQAATDAGQLLNEQQRLDRRAPRATAPNEPVVQAPLTEAGAQAGLRARIDRVRVTGAEGLMDDAKLQALVADAKGRTLSHAQLQQLANRVTQALQAGGYPLARAYLPRQDLTGGELEIAVLPGRLQSGADRIKVLHSDPALGAWLGEIAAAALPTGPVTSEQLERGMLLINDVPGVQARASLEKGDEPGSSRLLVRADTERRWNAQLGVDSFGNRYTGEWRASAQAAVYRPFGHSDVLTGSLSHARGSDQVAASYAAALNPQGLRAQFATNWLRYDIGGDVAALDLAGTASSVSGGLSYPLMRSRESSLWASADVERKAMTDKALGQELRSRRLYKIGATLHGSFVSRAAGLAQHDISVSFAAGQLNLNNTTDRQLDALTAGTAGGFSKVTWSASRLQGFEGAPQWSLLVGVSGQMGGRNLDSSEKFILGGPVGIRGHAVGEASGDSGWLANLEVRREFGFGDAVRAQAVAFVDHGRVTLHVSPWRGALAAGKSNGYALSGAGVGLNLSGDRWMLRSSYARAVGSNPGASATGLNADGRSSRHHLWMQAALRF
jgi:hemolysin activation/secretion protein